MLFPPVPIDYTTNDTRQFVFTPENFDTPYCFNVSIRDDNVTETTENFSLKLSSEDEDVKFKRSELQLEIEDNDCKPMVITIHKHGSQYEHKSGVFFTCAFSEHSSRPNACA